MKVEVRMDQVCTVCTVPGVVWPGSVGNASSTVGPPGGKMQANQQANQEVQWLPRHLGTPVYVWICTVLCRQNLIRYIDVLETTSAHVLLRLSLVYRYLYIEVYIAVMYCTV